MKITKNILKQMIKEVYEESSTESAVLDFEADDVDPADPHGWRDTDIGRERTRKGQHFWPSQGDIVQYQDDVANEEDAAAASWAAAKRADRDLNPQAGPGISVDEYPDDQNYFDRALSDLIRGIRTFPGPGQQREPGDTLYERRRVKLKEKRGFRRAAGMKITKDALKQMVKEETEKVLYEDELKGQTRWIRGHSGEAWTPERKARHRGQLATDDAGRLQAARERCMNKTMAEFKEEERLLRIARASTPAVDPGDASTSTSWQNARDAMEEGTEAVLAEASPAELAKNRADKYCAKKGEEDAKCKDFRKKHKKAERIERARKAKR